ncbi:F-box protein [Aspergillus undulatus]|uniref:F-box protein n=1 Tax=Aspergillus undulatus TaxID=1810928 RepID=UPI003CCE53CF
MLQWRAEVRCIVCGLVIDREGSRRDPWLRSYRMVYRTRAGVYISDVGVRRSVGDEAVFRVPLLDPKSLDGRDGTWIKIPIFQETDGRFGFVLHSACWCLLERRAHPWPIPLCRLFEIFGSAPRDQANKQLCCYTWDHMYLGLISFSTSHWADAGTRWPWQERRFRDERPLVALMPECIRSPFASTVYDLLRTTSPQPRAFDFPAVTQHRWLSSDCFSRLPLEVVEEISSYLPITTVLELRSISRAFTQLFYSQVFWASRFRAHLERGFLFEAFEEHLPRDWLWVYRRTTNISETYPGLKNRQRIWRLVELLLEKLVFSSADSSTHMAITRRLSNWQRAEVYGDLIVGSDLRKRGSGLLVVPQETQVPSDVHRLGVTITKEGETTYVTGIQFVHGRNDKAIRLGYITAPQRTTYVEIDSLNGFVASIGSRGIHALQIVHGMGGSLSPWLGCPDSGAKTRRLVFTERLVALSAGFDGYKLVYISAWGRSLGVSRKQKQRDMILNNLLWFPEIPDSNAELNECSIFGDIDSSVEGFRPVICSLFGGPDGLDLQYLIRVSVIISYGRLVNIGFNYKLDETRCPQRMLSQYQSGLDYVSINIDGPGGEFIEKVEVETVECGPGNVSGLRVGR